MNEDNLHSKTSERKNKKTSLVSAMRRNKKLSWVSRIVVVCLVFGGIGGVVYLYNTFASDGLPTGKDELVASYTVGMGHTYSDNEFPVAMPQGMLLYGNGLMLCNPDGLSAQHASHSADTPLDTDNWKKRQLTRGQVTAYVKALRSNGFDRAKGFPGDPSKLPPFQSSRLIRINTTEGEEQAREYAGFPREQFAKTVSFILAECNKTTQAYVADEVEVQTIVPSEPLAKKSASTLPTIDINLPSIDIGAKLFKGKTEVEKVKRSLSTKPKLFKKDGKTVRARYVVKTPVYKEPLPKETSKPNTASAATPNYRTRWLIVLAKGQSSSPSWATDATARKYASEVKAYYKAKIGKEFTIDNIDVVRSELTAAQLRVCPRGEDCVKISDGSNEKDKRRIASLATYKNLKKEFSLPGYSTNIITAFDASYVEGKGSICIGWGGVVSHDGTVPMSDGSKFPLITKKGILAMSNGGGANGCHGTSVKYLIAAHEFGHNNGLEHTTDGTLMHVKAVGKWPGVALNANQAKILKAKSGFFNTIAGIPVTGQPAPPLPPPPAVPAKLGTRLATGDLDKDGKQDIVGIRKSDGALFFYRGASTGVSSAVQIGNGWGGFKTIIIGDVNGDTYDDIIAIQPSGDLYVYPHSKNSSPAKFYITSQAAKVGSGWQQFSKIMAADINSDKYVDILSVRPNGELLAYRNTKNNTLKAYTSLDTVYNGVKHTTKIGASGWEVFDMYATVDVNADGRTDMLVVDKAGNMYVYPHGGNTATPYAFSTRVKMGAGWQMYNSIFSQDINGDKYSDVIALQNGSLYLLTNSKSSSLSSLYALSGRKAIGSGWNIYNP